ncbi:unnamed protein product [Trichobilharzia szidati]|nr:unnamed protein product [Trichobilharzia szidati]
MYCHILLFFFIAQICLNFTTSSAGSIPPLSNDGGTLHLGRKRQFFEPLDPNLIGKLFNAPREDNNGDGEYYPNPPGNVMRYGKRDI